MTRNTIRSHNPRQNLKKISLIIPCKNEEASLPMLYAETRKVIDSMPGYDWELLFINDGSDDRTLEVI